MKEGIVLQVCISKQEVDLLEGFQYVLVCISSFPNLEKGMDGGRKVALGHGGQEREEMEIEGGGAECPDERECEGLSLMEMDISYQCQETKKITHIPRSETHHPCPHFLGHLRYGFGGHPKMLQKGRAFVEEIHGIHLEMDAARA